jgi:hypothetical protein
LWSLGIEEQFYLIWPLAVVIFWRLKINKLKLLILLFSFSFALNLKNYQIDPVANFYLPQTRFWELVTGAFLTQVGNSRQRFIKLPIKNVISVFGLFILLLGLYKISHNNYFPGIQALVPVTASALLIQAGPTAWINRNLLTTKILVWIGKISFPIYLWHWPLLSFAWILNGGNLSRFARGMIVLTSVILAWLTYKLIEYPIRFQVKNKRSLILLIGSLGILSVAGLVTDKNEGLRFRSVVERNTDSMTANYESNPLKTCSIPDTSQFLTCNIYPALNAKKEIVIWGDSTAGMWMPAFLSEAKQTNVTVILIENKSCPALFGVRKTSYQLPESRFYCNFETKEKIGKFIEKINPDTIFLLTSWNAYSPHSNREFITSEYFGEANATSTTNALKITVPDTLERLSKISRVVLFKPWPVLPEQPYYEVVRLPFIRPKKEQITANYQDFQLDSHLINSIFEKMNFKVEFYDPSRLICDNLYCRSYLNNTRIYTDAYHLSPAGALLFKSDIGNLIWPSNQ